VEQKGRQLKEEYLKTESERNFAFEGILKEELKRFKGEV